MFRIRGIVAVITCTVALVQAQGQAQSQVKPFKLTGSGVADFIPLSPLEGPAVHDAVGTATHLGKYHAEGFAQLDAFTGPLSAEFSSAQPVVFTAANGDELHFDYAGVVALIPSGDGTFSSVWVAEFTPVVGSSTGRFAKVIGGSVIVTATTASFGLALDDRTNIAYSWEGSGHLTFSKP